LCLRHPIAELSGLPCWTGHAIALPSPLPSPKGRGTIAKVLLLRKSNAWKARCLRCVFREQSRLVDKLAVEEFGSRAGVDGKCRCGVADVSAGWETPVRLSSAAARETMPATVSSLPAISIASTTSASCLGRTKGTDRRRRAIDKSLAKTDVPHRAVRRCVDEYRLPPVLSDAVGLSMRCSARHAGELAALDAVIERSTRAAAPNLAIESAQRDWIATLAQPSDTIRAGRTYSLSGEKGFRRRRQSRFRPPAWLDIACRSAYRPVAQCASIMLQQGPHGVLRPLPPPAYDLGSRNTRT